ncbi:hypothetical protein VKS41_005167 [Umbelopsis sp. WA50703]
MSNSGDDMSGKRQRVSRACDLCRRKKVKCDGLIPVCSNCQQFNYLCTYKDTTKKRGPPKGYIEAIENRLYRMEALLEKVAASDSAHARAAATELNTPLETPQGETINSRPVRRTSSRSESNGNAIPYFPLEHQRESSVSRRFTPPPSQRDNELPPPSSLLMYDDPSVRPESRSNESAKGPVGQLSMDETGQMRYIGKSSGLYMIPKLKPLQNGAYYIPRRQLQQRNESEMSVDRQRMLDPYEIPSQDLSEHLIDLYFQHFYPFLPLLHKEKFLAAINGTRGTPPVPPILLNAIYAVASRVSNDPRVRSDPNLAGTAGDIFFERARVLLEAEHDVSKLSTIQALLLMSSHQHGAMRSTRAWLYNGMAFRFASDIGLNRNCDDWNIPDDVKDERKRVFWCCFVVDRLTSSTYGRTFTIDEADCDINLPDVSESTKSNNESPIIEHFRYLIQLCKILGYIIQNTYYVKARESALSQPVGGIISTLERKLTTWLESLPAHLQTQPNNNNHHMGLTAPVAQCQLHMFYHTAVVLLYRQMIPAHKLPHDSPQSQGWLRCSWSANAIVDIAQGMLESGKLRHVHNYCIYAIFTSAVIFVHNASAMDPDLVQESKSSIHKIMRCLHEIEHTWNTAARSSSILGGLLGVREIDLETTQKAFKTENQTSEEELFNAKPGPNTSFERRRGPPQQWLDKRPEDMKQNGIVGTSPPQFSSDSYGKNPPSMQPRSQLNSEFHRGISSNSDAFTYSPAGSQMGLGQPVDQGSATMDPFAAPGTVLGPSTSNYDPLATAFWGVPSSLDIEEWNSYLGSQGLQQQQQNAPPPPIPMYRHNNTSSPSMAPESQNSANLPNMRPTDVSPAQPSKSLIHTDQNVDILSGISMPQNVPSAPANSTLFNYYNGDQSKNSSYPRGPQDNVANTSTTDMMYW